jgi:hypothetical protein
MAVPYFYIIKHKESGKKYAGAKWAKNANPDNFMTESGYQTSSNSIKRIIKEEGLSAFDVQEIIKLEDLQIPFGCQTIDEYESWFLKENNCCGSKVWYNRVINASIGSLDYYDNMINKYGVAHILSTKEGRSKYETTLFRKTGFKHALQNPDSMLRFESTCKERHGVNFPMQSEKIKKKSIDSIQKNFGKEYTNVMQVPAIREKARKTEIDTYLRKYGVDDVGKIKWRCTQCNKDGTSLGNLARWHKNHTGRFLMVNDLLVGYTK